MPKDKRVQVFKEFETISGFSKVIGSFDGTNINVKALISIKLEFYVNRKGHQYNYR